MQDCGECRACCFVFPLPVLGKAADEWCKFICPSGCSVHGAGMPQVCREYDCYWRDHEEMPDELRPDHIGVVVTDRGTLVVGPEILSVLLLNPSRPGACDGREAKALIDDIVARGKVAIVADGPRIHIVYDRRRYPLTSPEEIETALRHDQEQDAERLKRIGAIPSLPRMAAMQ